jgi:DNA-binding FrmR family transcriptional regulator
MAHEQHAVPAYSENKQAVQQRLRRIEGQVRGLQRMVDEDAYCIDVLTQVSTTACVMRSARAVTMPTPRSRRRAPRSRDW